MSVRCCSLVSDVLFRSGMDTGALIIYRCSPRIRPELAAPTSTQTAAQSQTDDTGSGSAATSADKSTTRGDGDSSTGLAGSTPQTALSADQIINILQQSPDLVVELKSELADRMQQQGMQIDPNDISDQMLYNQISSNANLRASITTVLRARGYVSER